MTYLVYKEEAQTGPYDQGELLSLLQEGSIDKKDLIYFDGLDRWRPLEEIFEVEEQLRYFMDEGQDSDAVRHIYNSIHPVLGTGEEIHYISHQKKRIGGRADAVVATNVRLLVVREKFAGRQVEDYMWKHIVSVQLKEGLMGSAFSFVHVNEQVVEVDGLPPEQIAKLLQVAQEMRS